MTPPKFSYCFTNSETGMTLFDPFRFMLRRAYAEGTDLRLYMTPLHAAVRKLVGAIGLDQRYEFWLKEIVRINEEEAARAKRPAFARLIQRPEHDHQRTDFPRPGTSRQCDGIGIIRITTGRPAISSSTESLRLQRAHAPSSRRFRPSTDREEHRCASREQQSQARRLDHRQHRIGVTDYKCGTRPEKIVRRRLLVGRPIRF